MHRGRPPPSVPLPLSLSLRLAIFHCRCHGAIIAAKYLYGGHTGQSTRFSFPRPRSQDQSKTLHTYTTVRKRYIRVATSPTLLGARRHIELLAERPWSKIIDTRETPAPVAVNRTPLEPAVPGFFTPLVYCCLIFIFKRGLRQVSARKVPIIVRAEDVMYSKGVPHAVLCALCVCRAECKRLRRLPDPSQPSRGSFGHTVNNPCILSRANHLAGYPARWQSTNHMADSAFGVSQQREG